MAVDDPGFCIIIKHSPLDRMAAQQTVTLNIEVLHVPYRHPNSDQEQFSPNDTHTLS